MLFTDILGLGCTSPWGAPSPALLAWQGMERADRRTSTAGLQESFIYWRKFKSHRSFMCHTYYSCNHLKTENPVCVVAYTCDQHSGDSSSEFRTYLSYFGRIWLKTTTAKLKHEPPSVTHDLLENIGLLSDPLLTPGWEVTHPEELLRGMLGSQSRH